MPYITSTQVLSGCLMWVCELCMSLLIIFSSLSLTLTLPLCCQLLTSCGETVDQLGGFTDRGEDGRVTEGVLFRGTHSAALEAVNIRKSWRQRGNKGEKNREDKDFALTPRP